MKRTTSFLLPLIMVLLFQGCKKDNPEPDVTTPPIASGLTVNITGTVVGDNGTFITGAQVEVNGRTATSGDRGLFRMLNVPANDGRNFLKVHKSGYFFGGRNFYVSESGEVGVKVKLVPRMLTGTFNASAGGEVETSDGLKVVIPANSIEGGYQGQVKVYSRFYDLTIPESILEVPGMEGMDLNGDDVLLLSYGMGSFELENTSGDLLQLASGASAELTVPVPSSILGTAGPSIPLWYFDEALGTWMEEGSATLQGGNYVGEVGHFSVWNCDNPMIASRYNVIITCGGTPYANQVVAAKVDGIMIGTEMTRSDGVWVDIMPPFATVEVYALPGGANAGSYFLGSFQTGPAFTGLETLSFESMCGPHASVSGCAVDGSGIPVTNGYMYLAFDDLYTEPVFFDATGCFHTSYFDYTPGQMSSGASIVAWDLDNFIMANGPTVLFNDVLNVLPEPIVIGGSTASVNGRIYVSDDSSESFFYCLDAANGNSIWTANVGLGLTDASAAVMDNRAYIVRSGRLYCLNPFDGTEIWSNSLPEGISPFVENGVVYVSQASGLVRALDGGTGAQLWSTDLGAGVWSAPTISGDLLYCSAGTASPGVRALNKNDGSLVWDFQTPARVKSSPCVAGGKVFFGCDDQELYAVDALTGAQVWQATFDNGASQLGSPTAGNGKVYIQSTNHVRAFDMNSGSEVWMANVLSTSSGANPYLDGNRLFARAGSGPISCFNASNGSLLYDIGPSGVANNSVAKDFTVVDGVLFMHRHEAPQTIEARNAQTGQVIWTSPLLANMTAAIVVVDENGVSHYSTLSGMQQ